MAEQQHINEWSERLAKIETLLEVINSQINGSLPRISYLEKELERQKDSLKSAHNRIDAMDKRYYWIVGTIITIVASLFLKFIR